MKDNIKIIGKLHTIQNLVTQNHWALYTDISDSFDSFEGLHIYE